MHCLEMLQPQCRHQRRKQNVAPLWELDHPRHLTLEGGHLNQGYFRLMLQFLGLILTLPSLISTQMASLVEGVRMLKVLEVGLVAWFPGRGEKVVPEVNTARLDRPKTRVQDSPVHFTPGRYIY